MRYITLFTQYIKNGTLKRSRIHPNYSVSRRSLLYNHYFVNAGTGLIMTIDIKYTSETPNIQDSVIIAKEMYKNQPIYKHTHTHTHTHTHIYNLSQRKTFLSYNQNEDPYKVRRTLFQILILL